jgi:hypothetical protein
MQSYVRAAIELEPGAKYSVIMAWLPSYGRTDTDTSDALVAALLEINGPSRVQNIGAVIVLDVRPGAFPQL